ncbi:MAG: sigma-70 family RNA polymerase sigma factor [Lentisphaeria bacterium]|nr:sigma-70 family RNA polymerase sigma factor [Lentisphaeria bacterium]
MNDNHLRIESDEELVERLRMGGQPELFDELIHRHLEKTRSMIYGIVLNHHDADDLVQEVFVRAYRGISRFRQKAKFSTWLYRIAVNTSRSFLKKRGRFVPVENEHIERHGIGGCGTHPLQSREKLDQIGAALAALSPSLRAAIVLTAIEGHGIAAAADIEGCAQATMYWRIHKARKILKSSLKEVLEQ